MAIRFSNHDVEFTLKNKRRIASWIKEIAKNHEKIVGEITIIFCSDRYILEVNNQYLNHNYFTDIITFDYSEKSIIEGDIFISIETVLSNSNKYKSTFKNELLRVIIHGILHLIGFKDKIRTDRLEMRKNEDLSLKLFLKNDQ